jgi:hypothetical protein
VLRAELDIKTWGGRGRRAAPTAGHCPSAARARLAPGRDFAIAEAEAFRFARLEQRSRTTNDRQKEEGVLRLRGTPSKWLPRHDSNMRPGD